MKNKILNFFGITPPAAPSSSVIVETGNSEVIFGSAMSFSFNGEKTPGELGAPVNIYPNHYALRLRAYEANLTQDTVKIITNKYFKWTIGNGLKLQSEPLEDYLKAKGYDADWGFLRSNIEASFSLYASLKESDYSGMNNFHDNAMSTYVDSFLGGDCLVIYRIEKGYPTAQVIDGQQVSDPIFTSEYYELAKAKGNRIKHGVEIDPKGKHVAYYVRSESELGVYKHERVAAYLDIKGFRFVMAKLVYFGKHRINDVRGVGALSAILEKVDKLDRYTEATVGSAEERAKIVYSITHDEYSTGENPMIERQRANLGLQSDVSGQQGAALMGAELERYVARTTNKTTVNMPNGAKLQALESRAEINYQPLFDAIFTQVSAALDMPPEVALQKFSSNYSASRAAMKVWEYMVKIDRNRFANEFYKPFYDLFFYCEVLRNGISAPGFISACESDDFMTIGAYTKCRFEGVNMPHIDPVKEVKAVRELLGEKYKGVPIISLDQAAEQLNQGDWDENYKNLLDEVSKHNLNESVDDNSNNNI